MLFGLILCLCSLTAHGQRQDSVMAQALRDIGGIPFYEDASVVFFDNGRDKYEDLFAAVRHAERFVHLEYFKFYNDGIGGELIHLLHTKVQEGVEVRVLIDGLGNSNRRYRFDRAQLDSIRQLGIQMEVFQTIHFPWLPHYMHRDHRKIAVIDGRVAYLGGMNVADYYIVGKPTIGDWRDMHMRLEGSVVDGLQAIFSYMWYHQTGVRLDPQRYQAVPGDFPRQHLRPDVTPSAGRKRVALVNRAPGRRSHQVRQSICVAVETARDSICIVNPYPTNVPRLRKALIRALKRCVKVKILVSSNSDSRITPDVVGVQLKRLLNHGAELYYCHDAFHHDKYMTIDGQYCTIGTVNLDARSLRFDHETNVFIFDPHTTAQLNASMHDELRRCTLVTTREQWRRQYNLWHRVVGRVCSTVYLLF